MPNPNGPLRELEVLLNERDGGAFVFRRDAWIRVPINRAFVQIANLRWAPAVFATSLGRVYRKALLTV